MCIITWSSAFVASSLSVAVVDMCDLHVRRHLAWRYKVSFWFYRSPLWSHCRQSDGSVAINHDSTYGLRWFIQVNNRAGDSEFAIVFGCFSRIKKLLGRTETRTRDRICFQSIRTVWDISQDNRARIATLSLQNCDRQTDRLKENYSIDRGSRPGLYENGKIYWFWYRKHFQDLVVVLTLKWFMLLGIHYHNIRPNTAVENIWRYPALVCEIFFVHWNIHQLWWTSFGS